MNPLYKQQYDDGDNSEQRFKRIMESYGKTVKESTEEQNMFDHIDFFIHDNGIVYSVDVKGPKGKNRQDPNKAAKPANVSWNFVEFKNIKGNPGSLYGKADFIAFEVTEGFVIANRKSLINYCDTVVDKNTFVDRAEYAKYKMYSRTKWGNKDEISYIEISKIPGAKLLNDKDYKQ
jgi:hypothetical protein